MGGFQLVSLLHKAVIEALDTPIVTIIIRIKAILKKPMTKNGLFITFG